MHRIQPAVITHLFSSGRRDSNPRRPPWQGGTLPLSYSRSGTGTIVPAPRPRQAHARARALAFSERAAGRVTSAWARRVPGRAPAPRPAPVWRGRARRTCLRRVRRRRPAVRARGSARRGGSRWRKELAWSRGGPWPRQGRGRDGAGAEHARAELCAEPRRGPTPGRSPYLHAVVRGRAATGRTPWPRS